MKLYSNQTLADRLQTKSCTYHELGRPKYVSVKRFNVSNKPSEFKKNVVASPSPEDVISVRYSLPGRLVAKTNQGVEIRTCKGGIIAIPQSLVTATEQPLATKQIGSTARPWTGEGSQSVVLEVQVRRDVGRLFGSLVTEIARLTHELQKKS